MPPAWSASLVGMLLCHENVTVCVCVDAVYHREEEVLSCQDQLGEFKAAAGVLMKWLEETKEQVPMVQPNYSEQGLGNDVQKVNVSAPSKIRWSSAQLDLLPFRKWYLILFRDK